MSSTSLPQEESVKEGESLTGKGLEVPQKLVGRALQDEIKRVEAYLKYLLKESRKQIQN